MIYDAVIVGAGPAGLTAATYLARFRRSVLVCDGGPPRAKWIPESHNTPGFPAGVDGETLLSRLRAQATEYGAELRPWRVEGVTRADGRFELRGDFGTVAGGSVLLATGVIDNIPPVAGVEAAIRDSRVRICPICDAYEVIDKSIAVLGNGPLGSREKAFLSTYSERVELLHLGSDPEPGAVPISLGDLDLSDAAVRVTAGDRNLTFEHLYLALGCAPQTQLAVSCGAACDEAGALLVDAHQMTTVPGLFAAGDVCRGLNQIAVATGEAAIAATAMHNRLR